MSIFKNSFYSIKNNIIKYGSVFFALAAFGFALGVFVFLPAESSYADMDRDEKVTALIRIYEKAEPVELTVSSRTMSGDRNAPVEVVIVHDFTCPYCVTAGTLFERMRKTYPGLFRIYYITIPISGTCGELPEGENHPFADACIAALGTACAIDQKRFRVMYENLYSDFINGVRHSRESVKRIAEANRFDMDRFNRCFVSPEAQRFVRANLTQSENVGVTAIPTIFIDGRKMPGIINNEGVLQGFLEYLKLRKGR